MSVSRFAFVSPKTIVNPTTTTTTSTMSEPMITMHRLPELALLFTFDHMPLMDLWSVVPLVCTHWHQLQPEALRRRRHLDLLPSRSSSIGLDRQTMRPLYEPGGPVVHLLENKYHCSRILDQDSEPYHHLDTVHTSPRNNTRSSPLLSTDSMVRLTRSLSNKLTSLSVMVTDYCEQRVMSTILGNVTTLIRHWHRSLTTLRIVLNYSEIRPDAVEGVGELITAINQCPVVRLLQLDLDGLLATLPRSTEYGRLTTDTLGRLRLLVLGEQTCGPLLSAYPKEEPTPELQKLRIISPMSILLRYIDQLDSELIELRPCVPRICLLSLDICGPAPPLEQVLGGGGGGGTHKFRSLTSLRVVLRDHCGSLCQLFHALANVDLPWLTHLAVEWPNPNQAIQLYTVGRMNRVVSRSVRWFTMEIINLYSCTAPSLLPYQQHQPQQHERQDQLDRLRLDQCLPALERIKLSLGRLRRMGSRRQGCDQCSSRAPAYAGCELKDRLFAVARQCPGVREVHLNDRRYTRVDRDADCASAALAVFVHMNTDDELSR